jgi:serine/threonine protein kinase
MIINEISFLRELSFCANIIQLESVYKRGKTFSLVLKFAQGGSLKDFLQSKAVFCEGDIRRIMEQLLLALDLLHRNKICHRDIKLDNILLMNKEELEVCIADLGLACKETDFVQTKCKCGTPSYVDPDILHGHPFTTKSDIFSLGSLLFNLITGRLLFQGKTTKEVLSNNMNQDPVDIIECTILNVSNECISLLKKMVNGK